MNFRSLPFLWLCVAAACCRVLQAGPIPASKPTTFPDWWFERDIIARIPAQAANPSPVYPTHYPAADDFSVANIGQFKKVATAAAEELNAKLPAPGAGSEINALVASWIAAPGPSVVRDDFAALNEGQLKAVAKLFYDRLLSVGQPPSFVSFAEPYPWSISASDDDAFALVNLGQVKRAFSFIVISPAEVEDPYLKDSDGDGIPDGWEIEQGLDPFDSADADNMSGGQTYLQIYTGSLGIDADPLQANSLGLVVYSP